MNRTEAKQLIESPILKAFIEGKKIERICGDEWIDRSEEIDADHLATNPNLYRVKPGPREFYVIADYSPPQVDNGYIFNDLKEAMAFREKTFNDFRPEIIKVREVI
jgi:hypothetical protein